MPRPLVSVLVPVRDAADTLAEALASLSAQTLGDFEAIVVDDGSGDGSAALVESHARRDRRFRVLRQGCRGLPAALELARTGARGLYLARLDADDIALPGRLELQVRTLEAEGLAACGGRVEYFPRALVRGGARRYERWLNGLVTPEAAARDVFVECPIAHPALLARSAAVATVGGYRDLGWPEDYDLVLRLWASGYPFRNVERVVLRWREHPGRLSRTSPAYSREAFVRLEAHHLRATLLRGRAAVIWGPVRSARRSLASSLGKPFASPRSSTSTRASSAGRSTARPSCPPARRPLSGGRSPSGRLRGRGRADGSGSSSRPRGVPTGATS